MHSPRFDLRGPKVDLVKVAPGIVGRAAGDCVVSRVSCAFAGDAERLRLHELVPFTRRGEVVS